MSLDWKYSEDGHRIILVNGEPKSKLKVTGTRLAGILGLNKWNTPFQMWCEITKAARPPFEDTIYTLAGKAIEPKQIEWTKKYVSELVQSPQEFFGNRYEQVKYDFYPDTKIFGGMWDAKLVRKSGKVSDIFEYKTTKRAEDWLNQPPVYYLVQVLEYAYIEGAQRVNLVVSFLEEDDYNHPKNFVVTNDNTQMFSYDVDTTYINIDTGDIAIFDDLDDIPVNYYNIKGLIQIARRWWQDHIVTGISPTFDETKDKEYLDILRTTKPSNDMSDTDLVARANELILQIDIIKKQTGLTELEKQLKACEEGIKKVLSEQMGANDTKVVLGNYTLSKTIKEVTTIDEDSMKLDGIFEKYAITETKETLTLRKSKGGK